MVTKKSTWSKQSLNEIGNKTLSTKQVSTKFEKENLKQGRKFNKDKQPTKFQL